MNILELTSNDYDADQKSSADVLEERILTILRKGGLFDLGEAYIDGKFECTNLDDTIYNLISQKQLLAPKFTPRIFLYLIRELFSNPQIGAGVYDVAKHHYDLGNDLFSAMLDKTMSYTCGFWKSADTLEDAQHAKLDLICQKLKLEPSMKVLDIGCGWGNFAAHAAKNYGVSVVGLTISKEQAEYCKSRYSDLPIEIKLQDYRSFQGIFDRIVSIEMIEAVGRKNIPLFFNTVEKCLKPKGLFALQVISTESFSISSHKAVDQFSLWLLKHIFPNGYIPKLHEVMNPGRGKFIIEDVENFSTDYDLTLKAWRNNFQSSWYKLSSNYDDRFRRIWLYYLSGCMALFRHRLVQLCQIVYSKP